MKAREAAYFAVLAAMKQTCFVEESLAAWQKRELPTARDFNFAQEIAYGTVRMMRTLDCLGKQLTSSGQLKLKPKELALLRTALYQFFYMDRVPLFALINESVELAKSTCHATFAKFLNALLRKLETVKPKPPSGDSIEALALRYSYPDFFVECLKKSFPEQVEGLLEAGNSPGKLMVRWRGQELLKGLSLNKEAPLPVAVCEDKALLPELIASPDYYIQNATPAALIVSLSQGVEAPARILDLCASPGGKLLALHDLFPQAELFANDVSEEKMSRLKENCLKYGVKASFTTGSGEKYTSSVKFDLIIIDAPCSNSGVLNKRPEARWRLSQEQLQQLEQLQLKLIENALSLLSEDGVIWYMTCSILPEENEGIALKACEKGRLKILQPPLTLLPNSSTGWDGGFAVALYTH